MGTFVNGIHGPVQGAVGTVVGVFRNGKYYVRARAKKRRLRSKTEKKNREKLKAVHAFLQPLQLFLKEGFRAYPTKSHTYNAAKSVNLREAFEIVSETEKVFRPALVQVSQGELPLPKNITLERNGKQELIFNWDPTVDSNIGAYATDQVMLLAYNPVQHRKAMVLAGQFRNTGRDTLVLPEQKGYTYHIYIAFTSGNRMKQSNSMYLGTVKV
jgi:hypothetical protein